MRLLHIGALFVKCFFARGHFCSEKITTQQNRFAGYGRGPEKKVLSEINRTVEHGKIYSMHVPPRAKVRQLVFTVAARVWLRFVILHIEHYIHSNLREA